jgi:hypothetical protein
VNGVDEPLFPFEATQAAFERVQRVYRDAGAEQRCRLYAGSGGHRYYKQDVWPFMEEFL